MNGETIWTKEEIKLPKMKCSYGFIKHSHQKPEAENDGIAIGSPVSVTKSGSTSVHSQQKLVDKGREYSKVNIIPKDERLTLPPI